MLEIFREELLITILMLVFLGLGIFIRGFLGAVYQRMIREADNMAATGNKLLKQCKTKFVNYYQLNNGVSNIPVFVDKFLNRMAVGPISVLVLYHLSGQAVLLSVVMAGIGVCRSILDGKTAGEILPFYILSFLGLYLYLTVASVADIKERRRILKVNLVDYLENHLSARLQMTELDLELLYGKEKSFRTEEVSGEKSLRGTGRRTVELMPMGGKIVSPEGKSSDDELRQTAESVPESGKAQEPAVIDEAELGSLLQEFLTV